jgi:hypothetical protein
MSSALLLMPVVGMNRVRACSLTHLASPSASEISLFPVKWTYSHGTEKLWRGDRAGQGAVVVGRKRQPGARCRHQKNNNNEEALAIAPISLDLMQKMRAVV